VLLRVAAVILPAAPASAALSDPHTPVQSCFGIAAGQRAATVHAREHSSSFDEPRVGVGNPVFRVFELPSVGAAGSFLADIDGIDATHCP
jgi:hypothetical protein